MDISVFGRHGVGACQVNKAINVEYIELDDDSGVNDLMKVVNELRHGDGDCLRIADRSSFWIR